MSRASATIPHLVVALSKVVRHLEGIIRRALDLHDLTLDTQELEGDSRVSFFYGDFERAQVRTVNSNWRS